MTSLAVTAVTSSPSIVDIVSNSLAVTAITSSPYIVDIVSETPAPIIVSLGNPAELVVTTAQQGPPGPAGADGNTVARLYALMGA